LTKFHTIIANAKLPQSYYSFAIRPTIFGFRLTDQNVSGIYCSRLSQ